MNRWITELWSWRITQQSKRIEVLSMRANILPYSTQVLCKQYAAAVVNSSPDLPPSFCRVWWDPLPWHLTSRRLASMLNSRARFPLLCILCLLLPTGIDDGCTWPHKGCLLCCASKAGRGREQLTYANGIEGHRLDELTLFPTANEKAGHLVVMI